MPKTTEKGKYRIEAALFQIPGLCVFGHNFWMLRDIKRNVAVAQLHGLAMIRTPPYTIVPIGYTKDHGLRGLHAVLDEKFAIEYRHKLGQHRWYFLPAKQVKCVYEEADAVDVWLKAVKVIPKLNALNLDYPRGGINLCGPTINSNSIYQMFAEVMGVSPYRFPRYFQPGLGNTVLLSQDDISSFDFPHSPIPSSKFKRESIRYLALREYKEKEDENLETTLFNSGTNHDKYL